MKDKVLVNKIKIEAINIEYKSFLNKKHPRDNPAIPPPIMAICLE